ncbi:PTS sugar transporter subunit IIA [Streptococcus sp. zg-86]|uniref:PTS sugar transporter subunit IIA n=1 Tax=Streptococcus zhangguiae TaxID=2664091 RepID=A0A6I4RUB4_9STRE|nr:MULTISPECIES: PTS sugar transporter subunit IIA [unclassified Streptococcus]MTB64755.1 PTS sugar transporter subunit IIA [Streptococcus sp. zg-86]MTB91327.1 PTS sugar transporter subunit IIA [Streptococcus sp. zg-36]MWV56742.1 PTS sugar transporter subunit IIA [Streptococcus sp. zg-70]QTH48474.1 PTS sugar transporter subunit IIA [Streptococcus sp. zg-86]
MEFNRDNIFINVNVKDKIELFNYIANSAKEEEIIDEASWLVEAFIERENEVSTGLQDSFAIPHAKSNFIKRPAIFFLKLQQPIAWETFDDQAVSNVFALLVPSQFEGTTHLEMISRIATSLLEEDFVNRVKNSSNIDELQKIISKVMEGEQ